MEKRLSAAIAAKRAAPVRKRASARRRIKTFLAVAALSLLSVIAVAALFLVVLFVQESKSLPSLADIGNYKPSEGTKIFYSDGTLMAVLSNENRRPVKIANIDSKLVDATIAVEDSRFYEHRGVDYRGVARAVLRNIAGGDLSGQGASTITQQLARNINELGLSRKKKLTRKVREAILAVKIEQTFSKEEILELYLNSAYYGGGAHGVEAAAQTYFHKSAKKLSLAEASLLAGLPQRPVYFSDPRHRDSLYRRRDAVLLRMVETGKITEDERQKARETRITLYKPEFNGTRILGSPYFVNWVISQLVNDQSGESGYGMEAVLSGWSIYTTLDSKTQAWAEKTLRDGIHHYGEEANQGAMVCIDPRTGYIRAMVGGLDYKRDQFNIVTQGKRQPGSAFKPIVYTAALDTDTCTLDSSYTDDPYFEGHKSGPGAWLPKNYSGKYSHGAMKVLTAIKTSTNTVAVKVAVDTGIRTVIDYAHRMGITTEIQPYAPIALGAAAVRPIDLACAYTVFPNNGRRAVPMGITRVVAADGDVIDERKPELAETGIKPETIEAMNTALREVVLHGTGTAAASVADAHGKTGTTSDARDAWFAGYTPDLVTIIWVARENRGKNGKLDRKEPYREMPGATGGHLCAPIWRDFMLKAVPWQQEANKILHPPAAAAKQPPTDEEKKKAEEQAKKQKEKEKQAKALEPAGPVQAPADTQKPDNPDATITGVTPPPTLSAPPSAGASTLAPPAGRLNVPLTAPASRPEPSPTRSTGGGRALTTRNESAVPRISEPAGRIVPPSTPRADPRDEVVSVRLCADSMRRATQWCDSTVERRMRRRDIPGRCRTHRPPPGEEDR